LNIFYKSKNLIYLLYVPIFINFLINKFNFANLTSIDLINFFDIGSSLLLFIFLYLIGNLIKDILDLPMVSSGIVIYLLSFFLIDNLILFFRTNVYFHSIFLLVNAIWLFVFLIFFKYYKKVFFGIFSYQVLQYFNQYYFEKLSVNKNIIGDVKDIHFPHVKNIYEISYFYSMNNATLEGYPQLVAYVQSVLSTISLKSHLFVHLSSSINVLLFLFLLFFYELNLSKKSKLILIFLFLSLILNSQWLSFLFIDSLMTEGVLSYLFCVLLISSIYVKQKTSWVLFIFLGLMFLSKQFISILSLVVVLIFMIRKNFRKQALCGLFGLVLKELSFISFLNNIQKNYHLKDVDILDTVFDLILFRNLELTNIKLILQNLINDKPVSLIFLFFVIGCAFYLILFTKRNWELNLIVFVIILNFALIFALYITLWRTMELESPIRYMLNLLPLILYFQFKLIDKNLEIKDSNI